MVAEAMKDRQDSISSKIRQRLLAGETLNAKAVQAEYGCSSGLLALAVKSMQKEGHTFERRERKEGRGVRADWKIKTRVVGGRQVHSDVMPSAPASGWGKRGPVAEVVAEADIQEVVRQVEASQNGRVELPYLGQRVTISLLSVSEDGVVSLGLRDDKRTWLVQLTGQVEKGSN